MGVFPKKINDIKEQCHDVIIGLTANPATFPNGNAAEIQLVYTTLNATGDAKDAALALYRQAVENERIAAEAAKKALKRQLRQAEIDTNNDPGKLALIHWSPTAPKTPSTPPGEPRDFTAVVQLPTSVKFTWRAPARGDGGKVRDYRLDRREIVSTGGFTDWHEVATSFEKKHTLRDQPRGIELQYRVVALNIAGENPSRTVDVVL